jgi:hypothetical protein
VLITHLHTAYAGGLHHFPDTENLPQWNSAVTGVRPTDRSTYLMTGDLPTSAVTNELHVVAFERERSTTSSRTHSQVERHPTAGAEPQSSQAGRSKPPYSWIEP